MQEIRIGLKPWFVIPPILLWLLMFWAMTFKPSDDLVFNELMKVFLALFALLIAVGYWSARNWVVLGRRRLNFRPIGKVAWKDVKSIVVFGPKGLTRMGVQCDPSAIEYCFLGKFKAWQARRAFGYSIVVEEPWLAVPPEEFRRHVRKFHSIYVESEGLLKGLQPQDEGLN